MRSALWALVLSAIAVLIYLAVRFEYRFGIAAVLGVTHDVIFVLAALALMKTEINMPFIAAILTVVGYSLNNTIVVFDRIRENLSFRKKESLLEIVNRASRKLWDVPFIRRRLRCLSSLRCSSLAVPRYRTSRCH